DGNYQSALAAARRAIEINENETNALAVLARVLSLRVKEAPAEAARRAYDAEALPALRRLVEVNPNSWIAPKYLADIAMRRNDFDSAIQWLQQLQRLCPMDPASWRGLAGIYWERGAYDLALPQLLELTRIEESDAKIPAEIAKIYKSRSRNRVGPTFQSVTRLREAQYWYRRALNVDPFSVEVHKALADTCMQAGDTKAALDEYKVLTQLEPDNPKRFEDAAFAAHKLGAGDQAQQFARKAVALDPSSSARTLAE
ncbi:MAG: tetratricopeptide repeat protein, partial [Phycisphaerae bacterium]